MTFYVQKLGQPMLSELQGDSLIEEILSGTVFQKKVWRALQKIPRGQTRSYKEIAIAIGHPNSARAVANACGKNPRPLEIPCHRAIRSDGTLGGYSGFGGRDTKKKILEEEQMSLNVSLI